MFDLSIKDYTVSAGGRLKLQIPSDFFQIMEATGAVNVDFYKAQARVGYAEGVGQGFRLGPVADTFHGVEIYSATAQTLKLCFSRGKTPVDLSQVVSVTGTVGVINGEAATVKDGRSFAGLGDLTPAASNYGLVQLWNPAGSGKNLILTNVNAFSGSSAQFMTLRTSAAALATIASTPINKLIGSAGVAVGEVRKGSTTTDPGVTYGAGFVLAATTAAWAADAVKFSEPPIIPPGNGVILTSQLTAVYFGAAYEWIEEVI